MGTSECSSGGGKHRSGSVLCSHAHRLEFNHLLCCPAELCCVPLGIEVKFKNMVYPVLLAPNYIPELQEVTQTEDGEFYAASQISGGGGVLLLQQQLQQLLFLRL